MTTRNLTLSACRHDFHTLCHFFSLRPELEHKNFQDISLFTLLLKTEEPVLSETAVLYAPFER
jgi:hypothetical protein